MTIQTFRCLKKITKYSCKAQLKKESKNKYHRHTNTQKITFVVKLPFQNNVTKPKSSLMETKKQHDCKSTIKKRSKKHISEAIKSQNPPQMIYSSAYLTIRRSQHNGVQLIIIKQCPTTKTCHIFAMNKLT